MNQTLSIVQLLLSVKSQILFALSLIGQQESNAARLKITALKEQYDWLMVLRSMKDALRSAAVVDGCLYAMLEPMQPMP